MTEQPSQGQRFSQVYLRPDRLASDTPRLRRRLVSAFRDAIGQRDVEVGQYLERELGIELVSYGISHGYLDYGDLRDGELRDVLDAITLVGQFLRRRGFASEMPFLSSVRRILLEESASYRVDDDFGLHPAVDGAYQANIVSAVRSLSAGSFEAARSHIQRADDLLLPAGNTRDAIRAAFDAVENIYRQQFSRAPHINRASIQSDLRPLVDGLHADAVERRTASKTVESLSDWVDACHNYRHEPGHAEPTPPSHDLAVLLVSQGISYGRWLADLMKKAEA